LGSLQQRGGRTIGGTLYTTEHKYDLADNLIELVYPSGRPPRLREGRKSRRGVSAVTAFPAARA
jgi:hypothetical protein